MDKLHDRVACLVRESAVGLRDQWFRATIYSSNRGQQNLSD